MSGDAKQKPSRLGRGLSALIGEVEGASTYEGRDSEPRTDASTLSISDIRPNPQQPRRYFSEAELNELAESIRAKGVLQAILVRPFDYAPRWLRIGLPDSDGALTRLEQALSCG